MPAILSPIVALIYLVAMDWKFSLVLVGYIGVCLALAAPSMRRAYRTNVDSWNLAMSTLTSATVELGDGIEVVKTYGSGSRAFARYSSAVDSMVAVCVRWMSGMGRPVVAMSILLSPAVLIVVITATGTAMLSGGWITPVALVCLSGRRNRCSVVGSAHGNDGQPLPRRPTGSDSRREHPRRTRVGRTSGCSACSQHFGRIRQRRLRVHHWAARPREHLLRDATGHVTAIVGPSGSGKTTLARLLPRFWDVTDGSIRLGGSDLRDQSSREVLRSMAIVFQDVVLLRDSVRENIRLGRPDATDLEVETAARRAQIHDVIMRLPDGYDTEIGGGSGGELSGGEKQRLTIARAILQNPPIVILDEATSQADPHSESAVQRALGEISADGGTLMVIAHRLHTVRYADQILVLDAGRIVEKGTHEQLSALGGTYARMWALQNPLVEDISPRKAPPMIRDLDEILGRDNGMRGQIAGFTLAGILEGVVFALMIPILKAVVRGDYDAAVPWVVTAALVAVACGAVRWIAENRAYRIESRVLPVESCIASVITWCRFRSGGSARQTVERSLAWSPRARLS